MKRIEDVVTLRGLIEERPSNEYAEVGRIPLMDFELRVPIAGIAGMADFVYFSGNGPGYPHPISQCQIMVCESGGGPQAEK